VSLFPTTPAQAFSSRGWWSHKEELSGLFEDKRSNLIHFRGIIGTFRCVRVKKREAGPEHITFVTVWDGLRYLQCVLEGQVDLRKDDFLAGYGREKTVQNSAYVEVLKHERQRAPRP
jgi:hypothetical protein